MKRTRSVALLAAGCIAALAVASGALAASPQKIYSDYADNGQLDGTYSTSDLRRVLKSAVVTGYGHGKAGGLKQQVEKQIKKNAASKTRSGTKGAQGTLAAPPVKKGGGLPFTGLDLGLITLGAVSLLLFGGALRRFARQRQ